MENERARVIWDKLIAAGLSAAGAAALLGNLYAESALIPTNLQNSYERKLGCTDATYTAAVDSGKYTKFATDAAGYGLAQWTYSSRKQALLDFAKERGKSIGNLDMQLDFLLHELRESYPGVLSALKNAANVRAASDVVMVAYENPADQSDAAKAKRAAFGQKYFEQFTEQTAEEEALPNPPCPESSEISGIEVTLTVDGVRYGGILYPV